MLVLSRKENEKIRISDNIVITVLKVKGNKVSIGVDAPKNIKILRGELFQAESRGEYKSRISEGA